MKIKNIIILAAGDSSRFWPLENKCLINFLGKPLIFYILKEIIKFGENFWLIVNKNNKILFENFLIKENFKNINLLVQQDLNLGMAGAILACKKKVKGEVLVLNGSDLFDFSILKQYFKNIKEKQLKIYFLGKKINNYFPGGYFVFRNKKIIKIWEKPPENKLPSSYVKLVCDYFFDLEFLINKIEKLNEKVDDLYEKSLNLILLENYERDFFSYDGNWFYLKYPWHILLMKDYFLKEKLKNSIFIGKNVKISQTAKIIPPCFIGDNSMIGDFTMIRESMIGNNCLIGGYSEVTRSYLDDSVYLHRNYVGDSVLGEKVLLGAGSVLANYRFDEKEIKSKIKNKKINTGFKKFGAIIGSKTKIGINSTILPGVKIGKNTFIGPGSLIDRDIIDNKFIFKEKIKKNIFF